MGKYLKRIGTFFTMLLMLTALWSMTAMAATDTDRNAFYVQVPADWESPCVWAWDSDGNNAFEAWPGEEMEADPENEGWYYIWLPSFANHVIVNANDGSVQTTDISVESGKDIWLVINGPEDYTVSYEEPDLAAETEADTAAEEVTEAETAEEAEAVEETKEKSSPAGPIAAVVIVAAAGAGIGIAAKKKKAGK
jgi:hypothetical protein